MTTDLGSAHPRLAVLIPVYRHPALLIEAIESVLAQRFAGGLRLIVVNDGCPFPETDAVCRDYMIAYPQVVTYLRKPNGGLADARNFGIRHVLDHLPSVEAIYMLDADNRLRPDAMARAMVVLDGDADADWVYPSIDMFGIPWNGDYGGDYSLLIHTKSNICEAGSLIRRRVFEAEVFFDTGFRLGWEDWDFFLTAAERGFRGRNAEFFGLLYRKRAESMLAESERERWQLASYMRRKHRALFSPRTLLQLEQAEAPRFALYTPESEEFVYCVDPLAKGSRITDFNQFETDFLLAQVAPGRRRLPHVLLVIPKAVFSALEEAGLLHWVMWKLETLLETHQFVAITFGHSETERLSVRQVPAEEYAGQHKNAPIMATKADILTSVLRDKSTGWVDSLVAADCEPSVACIEFRLPIWMRDLTLNSRPAIFDMLTLMHRMWASPLREALALSWGFRKNGIPDRGNEHHIVREQISCAPVYPRVPGEKKHIGFLLPLVEFGGVEKVALQIARGFRAHGWVPHAFVLESTDIAYPREWAEVFETTNFLSDPQFMASNDTGESYLSNVIPEWARRGDHSVLTGMVAWLDAIINFHCGAAIGIMSALQKMGIKTITSLHLNDLTEVGRPVGNTYLTLAYEHVVDILVPCSHRLGDWLHGMGIPRDKIIVVPNGPGFNIPQEVSDAAVAARAQRGNETQLNVLFLGRLDRQKGIDRLAEVMARSRAANLQIAWRVIGKSVIAAAQLSPDITRVLEPPLSRPEDLAAAYAWADVVVLLSRYEGLPLTIIEAQRAGAWVIATNVGAVTEVVHIGENGTLISDANAVEDCMRALKDILNAPDRIRRAATARGRLGATHDWTELVKPLVDALEKPALTAGPGRLDAPLVETGPLQAKTSGRKLEGTRP
jgi:glycosyltransferase involved in cell wall biosynthesis